MRKRWMMFVPTPSAAVNQQMVMGAAAGKLDELAAWMAANGREGARRVSNPRIEDRYDEDYSGFHCSAMLEWE